MDYRAVRCLDFRPLRGVRFNNPEHLELLIAIELEEFIARETSWNVFTQLSLEGEISLADISIDKADARLATGHWLLRVRNGACRLDGALGGTLARFAFTFYRIDGLIIHGFEDVSGEVETH